MPAVDTYQHHGTGLESPASYARSVTPSDSVDLPEVSRALFASGSGTVRLTLRGGGSAVDFAIVPGVALPLRVSRVWATGTTATGLVSVW